MADMEKGQSQSLVPQKCRGLCAGDAWWLFNVLCCPFVLVYNSLVVYLFPCLYVMLHRLVRTACCLPVKYCFPSLYNFADKKFPHEATSVIDPKEPPTDNQNEFYSMSSSHIQDRIEWVRAEQIFKANAPKREAIKKDQNAVLKGVKTAVQVSDAFVNDHMRLFENGVSPRDIVQGGVGDCWLLAALASMAEYPEVVMNCFRQFEYSTRGKYHVRIYDCGKKEWRWVSVDDFLPVKKGTTTPYFSKPQGFELWVFLIEKAFAKYVGGYAYLDGGNSPWAWHTLTGDNVFSFKRNDREGCWERHMYKFAGSDSKNDQKHKMYMEDTFERCDKIRLFELIKQFLRHRAVMGASIHSKDAEGTGLVGWHAYSLIGAEQLPSGQNLVELRNPWGSVEWNGAWSDSSPMWDRHPGSKEKCKVRAADDGVFWMDMDDFIKYYDRIDVCDRSSHRDLRLDVNEDNGYCGVCKGFCCGCLKFWGLCSGARTIYFGHRTTKDVHYEKPWYVCEDSKGKTWNANQKQSIC